MCDECGLVGYCCECEYGWYVGEFCVVCIDDCVDVVDYVYECELWVDFESECCECDVDGDCCGLCG